LRIYVLSDRVSAQEMTAMGHFPSEDLQNMVDPLLDEYGPATQVAVFLTGSVAIPKVMGRAQESRLRSSKSRLFRRDPYLLRPLKG